MKSDIITALAGTYSLLNVTVILPDGSSQLDAAYGAAPVGHLTYTPEGYMSAVITATEPEWRPLDLTFPAQPNQTDEAWAALGKHLLCYAGPVSVSDTVPSTNITGQVIHGPLDVAAIPAWVGTKQARNYTVFEGPDGETLLKIASKRPNGTANLWWQRLPSRL